MNSQNKPPADPSSNSVTGPVILVIGVSGSGKSTIGEKLAERLGCDFLEGDDFHSAEQIKKMHEGHPLTDEDRWPWLDSIRNAIDHEIAAGKKVVIACSGLRKEYRQLLIGGIPGAELVYLRGDIEVIRERMRHRKNHFMPASLLDSQFATLQEPGPEEHPVTVSVHGSVDETLADVEKALGA